MKLGFFQYPVIWGNPAENFSYIRRALRGCRCDLLVLPELFPCGYLFDNAGEIARFAETLEESLAVHFLQSLAGEINGVVTGTIPEYCNGNLYNTAVVAGAEGILGVQRKVHLPEYEKRFFQPGERIAAVEIPGRVRIGMMSCFDCWFPQFGAMLKQQKAGIFCNSASFGGEVTPAILPIRALENQVFVISCNRIGAEKAGGEWETFCGRSQIVSPDGKILAEAGKEEKLAVVEVDPAEGDHPAFGSLICRNFPAEHAKYRVEMVKEGGDEFSAH